MLVQNIWRNILIIKALLEISNEWSLVRESAMVIGKTTMKRNLGTIEIWRKPCWGSVHRKNSTLQFGNLTRITLPHLMEVLPSVLFVALFFFNLFLFWVPSLVKTEIMKVWVRKKPVHRDISRYTGSPWRIVCMNSVCIWHGSHVGVIAAYTGWYITTSLPWSPFFPSVGMGKGKKKDSSK